MVSSNIAKEGSKAPEFKLLSDQDEFVDLDSFKGKFIVLYFYPKDDTPGCTTESKDFSNAIGSFHTLNAEIVGVSKDSVASHKKFKQKHELKLSLLSDESCEMIESYGAWVEKNMYGKKYMGIDRSTFLIDKQGVLIKIWRKVKVKGHVNDVLETLQSIAQDA